MIMAQIVCQIYIKQNLAAPADFTNAPWYVNLSFNSSWAMVKLFDLKETVLIYFIGFIGFVTCFVSFTNHFYIYWIVFLITISGVFLYYKAYSWMEKNQRWGTRKTGTDENKQSLSQMIFKDGFLIFNSIILVLLITNMGYSQLREGVRKIGYEAGKKEAIEQLKQDSLQNLKNK